MHRVENSQGRPMRVRSAGLAVTGLALVLMTAPALAQMSPQQSQMTGASRIGQSASHQAEDKNEKPKANDKAYNAALRNLPDKQYDPWHGVR